MPNKILELQRLRDLEELKPSQYAKLNSLSTGYVRVMFDKYTSAIWTKNLEREMENKIQIALLFKALAEGKRLYRLHVHGEEREYFFIEYYKGSASYRCWGWASALGQPIDRMREIIESPFEWHVEEE